MANSVSSGLADALVDFAERCGVRRGELLSASAIAESDISDADRRIPLGRYVNLMRAAITATGDPAFALHFGAAVDLEQFSIVGMIGRASRSMPDALEQLNRYGKLVIDVDLGSGSRFSNRLDDDGIWMTDHRLNPNSFPELTEVTFARMICGVRRIAPQLRVHAVEVTHAAPPHADEYDRIFGAPTHFGAMRNAYCIDPEWLSFVPERAPPYIFAALSRHADAMIAQLFNADSLRARVEALILPDLHTGIIDVERTAANLGMSRQTLYRRLQREGTSFATLLNDLRRRLAIDFLGQQKISVNQTAYLLGFADPAAFSRAFKRWTQMAPRDFRKTGDRTH